jgi:LacI family transcriptional regulator
VEIDGPRGRLEGGRKRATINDIARLAGVSKKTVSRVINQSPFVRDETRERIEAVIAEWGYAPDPQARGLAFRRSFLIGMIYDNPNPQYVVNMQLGCWTACAVRASSWSCTPATAPARRSWQDVRTFVERQKLFGVVLPPSVSEDERVAKLLREIGCEYIRIASVELDKPEHMIVGHDRLGGEAMGATWSSWVTSEIGFISGLPSFRSSHERRGGFEDALNKAGLQLKSDYVVQGAYTFESGLACGEACWPRRRAPPRSSRQRRNGRRRAAGGASAGLTGAGRRDRGRLRRLPDRPGRLAAADHDPHSDPRSGPDRRREADRRGGSRAARSQQHRSRYLVVRESSAPVPAV